MDDQFYDLVKKHNFKIEYKKEELPNERIKTTIRKKVQEKTKDIL